MSRHSTNSAKNSDATSKTRPSPRSERELLTHQADAAKAALFRTARETAGLIASALDPGPLIEKHPLQAAGFVAFGGFLVGAREKKTPKTEKKPTARSSRQTQPASPSLLSILITTGTEILKNALIPVVTTELSKRFSKES
jgi:hypothetical protein